MAAMTLTLMEQKKAGLRSSEAQKLMEDSMRLHEAFQFLVKRREKMRQVTTEINALSVNPCRLQSFIAVFY